MTRLDQQMVAALNMLNTDGPKIIGHLKDAAHALMGQGALCETLDDVRLQIAGLSNEAMPDQRSPELDTILNGLRRLYTMEAERVIHAQIFGTANATAPASEPEEDAFADFML